MFVNVTSPLGGFGFVYGLCSVAKNAKLNANLFVVPYLMVDKTIVRQSYVSTATHNNIHRTDASPCKYHHITKLATN